MTVNFDQKLARRIDLVVLDLIAQLAVDDIRLTPKRIDRIRQLVMAGMHEVVRLTEDRQLDKDKGMRFMITSPWAEDDKTSPETPTGKLRKPKG